MALSKKEAMRFPILSTDMGLMSLSVWLMSYSLRICLVGTALARPFLASFDESISS